MVKFQSEFQFARLNSGTELTHLWEWQSASLKKCSEARFFIRIVVKSVLAEKKGRTSSQVEFMAFFRQTKFHPFFRFMKLCPGWSYLFNSSLLSVGNIWSCYPTEVDLQGLSSSPMVRWSIHASGDMPVDNWAAIHRSRQTPMDWFRYHCPVWPSCEAHCVRI